LRTALGDKQRASACPISSCRRARLACRPRLGPDAFLRFLADAEDGHLEFVDLQTQDVARVRELLDRYRDLSLGFVDAAVLAIVERLGEPKLATLDHHHFTIVRPRHLPALRLVP
jgi:predicted nucleic acid-binding protein